MSYSQLTQKQRYEISALNERDIPQYQIANQVNVDPSTISRELNRNASQDGYDPDDAHRQAEQRQQDKNRTRIDQDDWDQVEKLLQLDWSPEQIAGLLDKNGELDISHEWIYQHVWQDKDEGGTLYENLRLGRENRKTYGTRDSHTTIKNRTSIEQRPDVVDNRKRVGDWEADLIIGGSQLSAGDACGAENPLCDDRACETENGKCSSAETGRTVVASQGRCSYNDTGQWR